MCSKGIAAVIGGILIHLTLGNLYSFGNMMTYMASYMHVRVDSSIDYGNFIWVNSITTAAQGCFMVFGGLLEKKVGPKITCFVGCTLLSAGIMLTHYTIEVSLFAVTMTYGLLSGLGISLSYVTPLACGMKWYPDRKGFINGMIVAGFGLGALGSTNFQTMYLNPDNLPPEKDGYFKDPELLNRVPGVFIALGVIFLVMQYIGCFLLSKPRNDHQWCQQQEDESLLVSSEIENMAERMPVSTALLTDRDLKPMEIIKNKTFYLFWLIYFFNTIAIGYINAMYKSFGLTFISDDHFLAVIGSLAAIFNAVGRCLLSFSLLSVLSLLSGSASCSNHFRSLSPPYSLCCPLLSPSLSYYSLVFSSLVSLYLVIASRALELVPSVFSLSLSLSEFILSLLTLSSD
ncbi:hypothetical protein C7M84_023524 [Penaeus vannamei]|uniref:Oxalate:formate antiporter n=1 Tax=Penaeus vannamei TaxID=6689 RepID=A0A423U3L7_PENVA|nr:hypothetical protein C7M84_023524 [Penaeus vannamei]